MKHDNINKPSDLHLINVKKSARLADIRHRAAKQSSQSSATEKLKLELGRNKPFEEELKQAQLFIDQQLNEILSYYPPNKRERLFKIRFGVNISELKQQSIERIFKILAIQHSLTSHFTRIKQVNYFGERLE